MLMTPPGQVRPLATAAGTRAVLRSTLLCFSHLRWNFVYQRPQHLLGRATRDHDVYFFEEPIFEEGASPSLSITRAPEGVMVVVPVLPTRLSAPAITRMQRRLVDDLMSRIGPGRLITWYYTPMALPFSRHINASLTVYDNMDELSAFRGASPRLVGLERELFRRADVVFTGGMSLYEAKRGRHPNVHGFPSSIDTAHFNRARRPRPPEPADQASIARPRLGFFGVIDERLDVDLVREAAALKPDWQFVMIGPVVKIDPATLPRAHNIHWLGGKSYKDLPAYLAGWDVGIMPFAINEATRFISPTKTPEFLAAGVPVVSTAITDVVRPYGKAGLVEIADDAGALCAAAERLFAMPREPWLKRVDQFLAANSWDRTWDAMQAVMTKAAETRRTGTASSRSSVTLGEAAHV